jgi:hypothetical protein
MDLAAYFWRTISTVPFELKLPPGTSSLRVLRLPREAAYIRRFAHLLATYGIRFIEKVDDGKSGAGGWKSRFDKGGSASKPFFGGGGGGGFNNNNGGKDGSAATWAMSPDWEHWGRRGGFGLSASSGLYGQQPGAAPAGRPNATGGGSSDPKQQLGFKASWKDQKFGEKQAVAAAFTQSGIVRAAAGLTNLSPEADAAAKAVSARRQWLGIRGIGEDIRSLLVAEVARLAPGPVGGRTGTSDADDLITVKSQTVTKRGRAGAEDAQPPPAEPAQMAKAAAATATEAKAGPDLKATTIDAVIAAAGGATKKSTSAPSTGAVVRRDFFGRPITTTPVKIRSTIGKAPADKSVAVPVAPALTKDDGDSSAAIQAAAAVVAASAPAVVEECAADGVAAARAALYDRAPQATYTHLDGSSNATRRLGDARDFW